ncbi:MAG TPA: hypothetical protein VFV17_01870 [Usitatibacteraceae bacterium]|nr:hypothetical protein [Usitatibacteraceae bacterium]
MIRQVLRKFFCGTMVWLHLVLLSSSPLLHAHSAEPLADPDGVHIYFGADTQPHGVCETTGNPVSLYTAEVADGRNQQDGHCDRPAPLPWLLAIAKGCATRTWVPTGSLEPAAKSSQSDQPACPQAP